MDTRIRIIAEAITKDAENNLKRLADLERELQGETTKASDAAKKQETNLNSLNDTGAKTNTMFRNIGATMIGLFAIDKIIDYSKQLITLMGDTDKYRIALMNVSTSQKEYEKSIEFISKLSKDYGQNVNILTQAYTNFIASSNSTNLSLKQRQDIYASIIKAGSALKLSNDSIEGSLRAVSQMFSKGNIQAEELRGQLGERLPGSFGIMAKALGVNEKQLNKMLEQGEVLAEDALPKFAKALEEVYGDKAQSNLKTIGGAWNVFVNNFIEGLQDFNKSSLFIETISTWILAAANGFKNFIGVIKEAFTIGTEYNTVLNTMFDYYEIVWGAIKNVGGALWDLIKTLGQVIFNITGAGNASKFLQYWVDVVSYAIKGLGSVLIGAITLTQALADTFNALINTGKKVLNFFGGDFKIDTNATFGAVADNFKKNVGRIGNLWTDSQKGILGTNKTTQKAIVDESENATNNIVKQNEGLTEKQKKELLKRSLDKQKALEKDQEENERAWKSFLKTLTKAMEDADKIMRKPFDEQYKRLVKQSKDEKEASDKKLEAQKQSFAEGLKLQAYYDMLYKIENAKTLKEIENAENEYSDKILKIDTDLLKEKIKNKKQELLLKKSSGALELADEEKLKEEIAKLEKELTEIKRKEGETQIKNKKDELKTSEDIEKENIGNRKRMWEGLLNTHISDTALASGKIKDIFKSINIGEFFANNLDEISNLLAGAQEKLDKIIAETTDNTKKFNAQMAKEMIKPWEENVNAAKALLSGDLVGAAKGLWGYVKGMWDMTFGLKKTMSDIKHDDFQTWYQENVKVLDDFQDKISSTFGDLAKQSIIASENIDNSIEGRINAEIKVGEQIKANYEVAVNAENKLYQTKIDNINKEYALKEIKALSEFGAASLSIKEKMNADLLAFVKNEESKISLTADYAKERNIVLEAYSDKIRPITAGMSQAEIDGIREAEKARDEALSKVEDWYTNELQIIFSNEEQKRKSYTETELVIKKGQEDLNTLKIQFEAAELQRNIDKNKELEKADEDHKKVLKKLEDDSNNALLDSFNRLKDAMKAGYQELAYAAYRAYQEGIINLDEYRKAVESVMNLRRMLGIPDSVPFVNSNNGGYTPYTNDSNNTPEEQTYATGTEYVDKFNKFPNGIDTVKAKLTKGEGVLDAALNKKRLDAGLDRFKTIEYAINYKSILDGGLQPLKIKESALNKLDEHAAMQYLLNFNMRPVVDELKEVKTALKSIPIQNFNLDEKGLSKYVETKNNVTKFKSKRLK